MAYNTLSGLRSANEVSPAMPTLTRALYIKTFLSIAEQEILHDRFGQKTTLTKGNGNQVMWRRWLRLAVNTVPLSEGITPSGKQLAYENVLGTVYWYGDWVGITDVVDFMHPDNVLMMATKRLALQAAETKDVIVRDVINAGTSFLRVTADGASPTTGVGARTTVAGSITKRALDTAITMLEGANAKYFHGQMSASTKVDTSPLAPAYVCIIHPHVAHDLVNSNAGFATGDWIPRQKYASGGVAYPTEIGTYRNVRFVTTTLAKVWPDAATGISTGGSTAAATFRATSGTAPDVYSCLVMGKDAYGVIKLEGAAATYYDRPGGNSDPLHQRATAGWKACLGAAILEDEYMVRIECCARW
jgi:N4-gp56 family major capsid protein